jgi:hypothetical protein
MPVLTHHALAGAAAAIFLVLAARSADRPVAGDRPTASAASREAPSAPLDPCKLLTRAQVETVLPKHDGGTVAHAGGSLIRGVDAYQCSYMNEDVHIFTVIVNVAVDDRRFADIRPHFLSNEATRVAVGEGGWLRGEPDDMKLTAVKGRSVLDLELLSPDAGTKRDALVALARAAIARL